ncbi:bifunctional diguanylate cyclase/phosphodiesterase [Massilia sp. 9096]|uniref:putative bifunctional diguanylate cyclase/phosphodiesterase n=1 Tax=Massilia sp. 9096 TaxID=1500894 RepID=UPI00055F75B2|nr:EAL domain-containing protein [Massilia sp. 9096]
MPASNPPDGVAQEEDLVFADEAPAPAHGPADGAAQDKSARAAPDAWRVMVVDDDADVHSTTTFALAGLEVHGRSLQFVHAHSRAQAERLLAHEPELAVILLDVVMEQADAGLHLVRHIRDTLGMHDVRIILRTGQPGYAPEMDAIRGYDINDYRTKSELTRTKLYTSVAAAIRAYQQIRALEDSREALAQVVRANAGLMALHSVDDVAHGILAEASRLLGQHPDGLLCACRRDGPDGPWAVLASAGASAALAPAALLDAGAGPAAAAIARCFATRANTIRDGVLALYLPSKSGVDFAAALPLARPHEPIQPLRRSLLEVFASSIAVSLDNVALMTDLQRAAFYDPLTGLPNRTRLVELLEARLPVDPAAGDGAGADPVLCLVDIDHFAETNDALGHQFGDALLAAVAHRLRARLDARADAGVSLARIGSDVFCVLGPATEVDPHALGALFASPFSIEGQDVRVSATLGLVRLREHEGNGADALKDADIALKRAKTQQRGGHFWFSRSMGVEIRERVRMMHALRSGFTRGELFLNFQPQVDLSRRRAFGAEALLRWRPEDGRLVPPDRFIPIAEYSGLIIEIGEWVLRQACLELMRVRAAGHLDFTMSVNVSQVQFRHPNFLEMVARALADTCAPPECIELEITESMAMEEPGLLIERLAQLKRLGVSIAIDDFGTGFSSLSYLQRLQVDRLKIDRAFVSEITGSARGSSIAEMVIELGRNLGLSIVAEGVEDERQAQILHALGCPLAQGYLFARPLPADQLIEWLDGEALSPAA